MENITSKQFLAASGGIIFALASMNLIVNAPKLAGVNKPDSQQRVAATGDDSSCVTTQQEDEVVTATFASVPATEETIPLYNYVRDDVTIAYNPEVQEEIYKQWSEFDGILPDYEFVLSFWISESGLNQYAINYNDDGTQDIGIPQINTVTIQEAYARGWMDYSDDIYDLETQIHVGLCILNYYCEACPGGDYPYYRAIRAYGMGEGGLEYAESVGDYGQYDYWTELPDGSYYPGKYGTIMETASRLMPVENTQSSNSDN